MINIENGKRYNMKISLKELNEYFKLKRFLYN